MSIESRLQKLERKHIKRRMLIALPYIGNDNLVDVCDGVPENKMTMTIEEFETWAAQQPDTVTVMRMVFPEDDMPDDDREVSAFSNYS